MITASNRTIFPPSSEYHTGEAPTLSDIARGLGRICRFAGQCDYYTVLAHTLVGAKITPAEQRVHFLLHDAAESVIGDVVSTWKNALTKNDEAHILRLIYEDLGIDGPNDVDQQIVKEIDLACLAAEAHVLGHAQAEQWWPQDQWTILEHRAAEETQAVIDLGWQYDLMSPVVAATEFERQVAEAMTYVR